ncbi:FAD-dependent oxidoreductase [candidate division WOR-3 bacterium]|nr:FAD-dependent oxidoreductase [candidate division WOR-3 bacterium]
MKKRKKKSTMKKKRQVSRKKRLTAGKAPPQVEDRVTLTIDDHTVSVDTGTTVLEAARMLNIEIPTLCYHKALSSYGACRLCVVEITQDNRKKIQSSCVYPAQAGLVVRTNTEEIQTIRKTMMQLLLARCPDAPVIQEMARTMGVVDTPYVRRNEDCILCGLCVRMCSERMGRNVIGFASRGDKRLIAPPFDVESPRCMACGACFQVCPTSSKRLEKLGIRKPRPLLDEFDERLRTRPAIRIPFPQAVPNSAIIDKDHCMHFITDKCRICQDLCEAQAIDFDQHDETVKLEVGAVIIASGFEVGNGTLFREFGNGRFKNVVMSIEFERILSASGPYQGHVQRPGDLSEPRQIAFIQCVGSRDDDHPYCSSVCCMHATKQALIAREHSPDLQCTIFFMDLRAFGKGFDEYYEKALQSGIRYIRCRPSSIDEVNPSKSLYIRYSLPDGSAHQEVFDMVVLSCGLHPSRDSADFARKAGISLNKYGFCTTAQNDPVQSTRAGVFVCGPCTEPKDIPETVTQSSAAAAKAMQLLASERHALISVKQYPPEINVRNAMPRIGVFVCHCGINIGGYVDVAAVVEHVRNEPDVVYAESNLYTCSQDSQHRITNMIATHRLNRIVVASCTPRTHEPLFRETMREAGLNPYLFEMANIRDQCSWIHMHDRVAATEKAKDLVSMAAAKARFLRPLKRVAIAVNQSALVIGGGIAGMVAAYSLAEQGYNVCLVEKKQELGGHLRNIHYTLENDHMDDFLAEQIKKVHDHLRITVYTGARIESINGFVGNYETVIRDADRVPHTYQHGVVIVATGGSEYVPQEYGYGKEPRVVTQQQLEQYLVQHGNGNGSSSASVPGIDALKSVVMIQCVGSRNGVHPYCSRRCCAQAVKNALKLRDVNPYVQIFILYRDVRMYGFKEDYYTRARRASIMFVRYDEDKEPAVVSNGSSLEVRFHEPVLAQDVVVHPDVVVLSSGIIPNEDNEVLARMLKVPLNKDGYFLEAHVKLRPVDFATEGIFVAGLAHSPKLITETICQAQAAAARASTILAQDTYYAEATVSEVNEELCAGCGMCTSLCPYKAIEMKVDDNGKRHSHINEALCKGCGTCAASCPSGAIEQWGFTKQQIMAMVDAVRW